MSSRARKIIDEVLALLKQDLARVVAELQQSVEGTDSPDEVAFAWRDEVVQRLRSLKHGSAILRDGDEIDRELSKILEEG